MLETPPKLVLDDPWLEPYAGQITRRMGRCESRLAEIRKTAGSLKAYATWHNEMGIHRDHVSGQWSIREWAPQAKSVALLGDFNDWNPTAIPSSTRKTAAGP